MTGQEKINKKQKYLKTYFQEVKNAKLIPDHQFGFRQKHSTTNQMHRITNVIEKAGRKTNLLCTFLDVALAFGKLWHEGLIHKIKKCFLNRMLK
jgi:hypothetical protein